MLQDEGFKLNPYDKCVAIMDINVKQCTIVWHVDDCLAIHVEQTGLDKLGATMIKHFQPMDITTGDIHDFLGMKIILTKDRKVKIDMTAKVGKLIEEFEADEQLPQLDNYKTEEFHTMTAKLLYVMKQARSDMETTVSFLIRRVSNSNTGDWDTLLRALGWLKRTKDDIRIIGAQSPTD
eukprot:9638025-Ditylum_brightwellii.AAC.1